ncbi:MAG: glycosyltransferase [Cyanosarcina radialis HA8281-LM2]|jgi:glycosyltransferase involved in cell wall biosynthesis|nr:glycosyltransferase [Cyanosarcina radialis HA8281-LM2]
MRLVIVQYFGDYRAAFQRFSQGEKETYHAQKYSVDAVTEIAKKIEEVSVLCCLTPEPYHEVLSNGVKAIGTGFKEKLEIKKLINLIREQNPTHLIVRTPIRAIFAWAVRNNIPTIAILADSFLDKTLRHKINNFLLTNCLNDPRIEWIGNHGINACQSLHKIGVNPNKIIPYDMESSAELTPANFSPKTLRENVKTWDLLYVGSLVKSKGVGDILDSILQLKAKKIAVNLKIAGKGEMKWLIEQSKQLKIEDSVEFLGLVANHEIINLMRKADLVIIPSRHEYPEGLPFTIYESLCARTPIVASDHPMFYKKITHGTSAMIFPAGKPTALTACIEKLISDPTLYYNISVASESAWKQLQIPVKWADFINSWIDNSPEKKQWLFEHRFNSGKYDLG